jgi:hypothetical protein
VTEHSYPSFGQYIRAARLGYHWHEKLGAFLHRVWWQGKDRFDPVALSDLNRIRKVNRPFSVYLDDNGRRIG